MKTALKHLIILAALILWFLQAIYTVVAIANPQFRLEEFYDITSIYWFQHRLVINGAYANVGWYAPLAIIYKVFGFSFTTGKILRSILYLLSILSLASVLKQFLGERRAILPLLVIGLSPALLFFTSIQVPWGLDLEYLPICLYLALSNNKWLEKRHIREILLGGVSMIAWLSYPTFVYYLVPLFLLYVYRFGGGEEIC